MAIRYLQIVKYREEGKSLQVAKSLDLDRCTRRGRNRARNLLKLPILTLRLSFEEEM